MQNRSDLRHRLIFDNCSSRNLWLPEDDRPNPVTFAEHHHHRPKIKIN